jgi:endonuclease/exonuclease/phosphatase family metal-dependent hydrolase
MRVKFMILPNIFTVLAYNTHLFVNTIAEAADADIAHFFVAPTVYYDYLRIEGIIRKIKEIKPDIVGLSEVWANNSKMQFIDGLRDILPFNCFDDNYNKAELGSGLLLLSKHEIDWHEFEKFPTDDTTSFDRIAQKGFLKARILVGNDYNRPLTIVLTHTNSGGYRDEGSDAARARKRNFDQIRNWINMLQSYQRMIVMGDFNVDAFQPEYDDMLLPAFKSCQFDLVDSDFGDPEAYTADETHNELSQFFSDTLTKHSERHNMRIDYIFISTDKRGPVDPIGLNVPDDFKFLPPSDPPIWSPDHNIDLSDHYPLLGAFDMGYGDSNIQSGWAYCPRCKGLYHRGRHATGGGHCPANNGGNGPHAGDISFNYALMHDIAPDDNYHSGWRFCGSCRGLFFGPEVANSKCPTNGGPHNYTESTSFNYALLGVPGDNFDPGKFFKFQPDWRYCTKCKGLFYMQIDDLGVCPAGDAHNWDDSTGDIINYLLPYFGRF